MPKKLFEKFDRSKNNHTLEDLKKFYREYEYSVKPAEGSHWKALYYNDEGKIIDFQLFCNDHPSKEVKAYHIRNALNGVKKLGLNE